MNTKTDTGNIAMKINALNTSSIDGFTKQESLKLILSLLDLTTLEGSDHDMKVVALCSKAMSYEKKDLPNVAAVCVYPNFAALVRKNLQGSNVKTAVVAGAFPSGQSPLSLRLEETRYAVEQGAQEIDMVISRGRFLQGDFDFVKDEILRTKEVCENVHLKVILETGELASLENVRIASDLAIASGADFIKTSTGKIQPAATPEAVWAMLESIRDHYQRTGQMVGIKPAGGISEPAQAFLYANLVLYILGSQWLNNQYFRIGASRLADNIIKELELINS